MINQEELNNYRKKFEEIKQKIPVKLKDWDELVYQDYPELVATLIYSLQKCIDNKPTQKDNLSMLNEQAYQLKIGSKEYIIDIKNDQLFKVMCK